MSSSLCTCSVVFLEMLCSVRADQFTEMAVEQQ